MFQDEVSHVSSWFEKHKEKPTLKVAAIKSLDDVRKKVKRAVNAEAVHEDHVVSYLYNVLKVHKVTLHEDWKSYGITIGTKGSVFTPFSLVKVIEIEESTAEEASGSAADPSDDKWLPLWILSFYRLKSAEDARCRDSLTRVITKHIKNLGCRHPPEFSANANWVESREFRKIVACVDYFFYHFDTLEHSYLRIGTIGSRLRNCASVSALLHAAKLIGLSDIIDIQKWIVERSIAIELIKFKNEEIGSSHSYFPYQVDLGLVSRCAYSHRLNPALHAFCHIIGTLLRNEQSQNAKFLLEFRVGQVIVNAQWVAYVFARSHAGHAEERILKKKEESQAKDKTAVNKSLPDLEKEPTGTDSYAWLMYMKLHNFELTEPMLNMVRRVQADIVNPRPGTIAELATKSVFLEKPFFI